MFESQILPQPPRLGLNKAQKILERIRFAFRPFSPQEYCEKFLAESASNLLNVLKVFLSGV
jgi:hypothetical protein